MVTGDESKSVMEQEEEGAAAGSDDVVERALAGLESLLFRIDMELAAPAPHVERLIARLVELWTLYGELKSWEAQSLQFGGGESDPAMQRFRQLGGPLASIAERAELFVFARSVQDDEVGALTKETADIHDEAVSAARHIDKPLSDDEDETMNSRIETLEKDLSAIKTDVAVIRSNYATREDVQVIRAEYARREDLQAMCKQFATKEDIRLLCSESTMKDEIGRLRADAATREDSRLQQSQLETIRLDLAASKQRFESILPFLATKADLQEVNTTARNWVVGTAVTLFFALGALQYTVYNSAKPAAPSAAPAMQQTAPHGPAPAGTH